MTLISALFLILMATLPVPLGVRAQHQALLSAPLSNDRPPPSLPVQNATQSFWLRDPGVSPAPDAGSEGELTRDADICIIGSGITGVSAAYHLATQIARQQTSAGKPVKAVILEARDFC